MLQCQPIERADAFNPVACASIDEMSECFDINLSAVAALAVEDGPQRRFECAAHAALNAGLEPEALIEAVLQTFVFGEYPNGVRSMKTLQDVFHAREKAMASSH